MLINLKSYKLAKQFTYDSKSFLKVLDLSLRGLSGYKQYKPIANIISEIQNNEAILKAHLNTAEKILAKKEVV